MSTARPTLVPITNSRGGAVICASTVPRSSTSARTPGASPRTRLSLHCPSSFTTPMPGTSSVACDSGPVTSVPPWPSRPANDMPVARTEPRITLTLHDCCMFQTSADMMSSEAAMARPA
jgi:hypothetical protein